MASRIESYGMIGNSETVALISDVGSLDWMCAPRFDSDACFASLIGYAEHGLWALRPIVAIRRRNQRYRGDTLIIETDIECEGGVVRHTDFMPTNDGRCDVIRIIEGVDGEVPMEMLFAARFGYGTIKPTVLRTTSGFTSLAGPDAVTLRSSIEMRPSDRGVVSYFTVKKGNRVELQFSWHPSHKSAPPMLDVRRELDKTNRLWLDWASRCTYDGRYREAVMRSLITLKALTYAPTGAIVAAPTTSLPEEIGGVRNWDYRFCWLRDASLTLSALILCGYVDEAVGFRDWLLRATAGDPEDVRIMYDLGGGRRLTEFELDELPGYEGSRPVRIGNAASDQFQLDVFGEVVNTIYRARKLGMPGREEGVVALKALLKHVDNVWQRPDDGIWEVRGGRQHFTFSKISAWVAIDRAVRFIEESGPGGMEYEGLPHLRALRETMHEEICQRAYHPGLQAFTQFYGGEALDASALLIPRAGFLPANDPRVQSTVKAIERTLVRDGLVLRYATEHQVDGLPGSEGAFLACSFWLADYYAYAGRTTEAEELFERLLALRNPLGLLAEEYDTARQRQIGNFPQAFSHLALIGTAHALSTQNLPH
jgi:GH15 family glucan-1,4-alpha-glucosidase